MASWSDPTNVVKMTTEQSEDDETCVSAGSLYSPTSLYSYQVISPVSSTNSSQQYAPYQEALTRVSIRHNSKDEPAAKDYGYREASPDPKSTDDDADDDIAKYGYEDAPPTHLALRNYPWRSSLDVLPRRSSLKMSGRPRRASIHFDSREIEVLLPGQKQKVKRKTSITFNERCKVTVVKPARELTTDPGTLWFQGDEYERMRRRSFELAEKADQGITYKEGKRYCFRGLEKIQPSKKVELWDQKYNAWDTVLDEQEKQRQEGIFDEDMIAKMYKCSTVNSQHEAAERGKEDAAAIKNFMQATRRSYHRSRSIC